MLFFEFCIISVNNVFFKKVINLRLMLKKIKAYVKLSSRRLVWKAGEYQIKVENNGAVVYVESSLTAHSPFLFTNCDCELNFPFIYDYSNQYNQIERKEK